MGGKFNFYKLILIVVTAFFIPLSIFINFVLADGGLVTQNPETLQWSLQKMNKQLCVINYENGFENMLLSIYVNDLQGEKAVWIFPVPAKPDKIAVDITKSFPVFHGRDIKRIAKDAINIAFCIR
ncbi:MAG: hypothetical protein QMD94_05375 [Candidatus Omnitrophota bacterium]|nr:hypothetical protein [Candidatus Omnitrophota bacterium]